MIEQAPTCKNPQCPGPRDKMVLLEETPSHLVFGCKPCRDIHKVLSVQVRVKPLYRRHVIQQLQPYKKARAVEKDRAGRITYFF